MQAKLSRKSRKTLRTEKYELDFMFKSFIRIKVTNLQYWLFIFSSPCQHFLLLPLLLFFYSCSSSLAPVIALLPCIFSGPSSSLKPYDSNQHYHHHQQTRFHYPHPTSTSRQGHILLPPWHSFITIWLTAAGGTGHPPLPHPAACHHAAVWAGGAHLEDSRSEVLDCITGLSSHIMDCPTGV